MRTSSSQTTDVKRTCTFDIETDGLLDTVSRVWCLSIFDHQRGAVLSFVGDEIPSGLATLDEFDVIIGHNIIGFDLVVLRRLYDWTPKAHVIDTLLMSRAQRPDRRLPGHMYQLPPNQRPGPHSVAAWAVRLGGEHKIENEDWSQMSPVILERNQSDVRIQHKIYLALLQEAEGEDWERAHYLNGRLFHYLQLQEETGFPIDRDHMDKCCYFLGRWIGLIDRAVAPHLPHIVEDMGPVNKPFKKNGEHAAITQRWDGPADCVGGPFTRINLRPVSLDSNKETKDYLLSQGWQPQEWNYDTEGNKTSPKLSKTDTFEGVDGKLGKLIAKRVQCRHRLSQVQGLAEMVSDQERIPSVVTGITTTARARHAGIVNIPGAGAFFGRWMRQIFVAPEGRVLIGCDSAGNQIRQLAARMGDEEFTNAVLFGTQEDGTDMHSVNQRRANLPTRTLAKNFIYGFLFGAGDAKLGKIVGGTKEDGAKYRAQFLAEMPQLAALLDRLRKQFRATARRRISAWGTAEFFDGHITGLDGRRIDVPSEHMLLVYLLQSDEAIHMATAYCMMNVTLDRKFKRGVDFDVHIWYHDEYVVSARPEVADEVAKVMEDAIAKAGEYLGIPVPHEGDAKIGANWYDVH